MEKSFLVFVVKFCKKECHFIRVYVVFDIVLAFASDVFCAYTLIVAFEF